MLRRTHLTRSLMIVGLSLSAASVSAHDHHKFLPMSLKPMRAVASCPAGQFRSQWRREDEVQSPLYVAALAAGSRKRAHQGARWIHHRSAAG